MSYTFHDIKHIVQLYINILLAHSMNCQDHPLHYDPSFFGVNITIFI